MARLAGLLVLLLLCTNVLGLERKSSLRLGRSTMSHSVKDQVRLAVQQAIASTVKDCDSEDCDIPGEVVYTEGSSGGIDEGLQGVADTIAKIDEWIKNFREEAGVDSAHPAKGAKMIVEPLMKDLQTHLTEKETKLKLHDDKLIAKINQIVTSLVVKMLSEGKDPVAAQNAAAAAVKDAKATIDKTK